MAVTDLEFGVNSDGGLELDQGGLGRLGKRRLIY